MGEYLLVVIIYVDDVIILASDVIKLKWLKSKPKKKFEMSDFKELHYCFGVEFDPKKGKSCNIILSFSLSLYLIFSSIVF